MRDREGHMSFYCEIRRNYTFVTFAGFSNNQDDFHNTRLKSKWKTWELFESLKRDCSI